MSQPAVQPEALTEPHWRSLAAAHLARASRWTAPARRRRDAGVPHPVEDFLFTYYPYSFSKLEQWHPPAGTSLRLTSRPPTRFRRPPYRRDGDTVTADPSHLGPHRLERLRWIRNLLQLTARRAPILACHGLHEWAMVYRGLEVRHAGSLKLRLPQDEIDHLVESRPLACSHFDAFRFFHPDTRPLNRLQPSLLERERFEQPACVHANMDLYKWAAKSMPWIGSGLLLECFELALELRDLDMAASPYDLRAFGLEPIPIETADGPACYENEQRRLAASATTLRQRLIEALDLVFRLANDNPSPPVDR